MHPNQYLTMTNRMTRSPNEGGGEEVVDAPLIPEAGETLLADKPGEEKSEDKKVDEKADEKKPDVEVKDEKKPEEKTEDKPAAPVVPVVPEAYELKAADGVEVDKGLVDLATPVFKELSLTNDQAQKISSFYETQVLPGVSQSVQGETLRLLGLGEIGKWTDQSKADTEIGGAKLEETLAMAAKARDQFSTPALKTFLEESRIGNHPEVVRFMAKVGRAISEGTFETGGHGASEAREAHQILYGAEFQRK